MAIQMTGIVPLSLQNDYPTNKLRPPIRARLVCTSLTSVWDAVIKPKLQFWQWSGRGRPGHGSNGHWGWIPPEMLIKGSWIESWSEKNRILTLVNGSTLQIMSYDQDLSQFPGGSFHVIMHDEGPPAAIYRENRLRTLDTAGRLYIAMTPPDDEAAAWDAAWVYDELYQKGLPGPDKNPTIDSFTLFTEKNRILDQGTIAEIAEGLTPDQREVRLHGRFLHLGGRIYPTYTHSPRLWCHGCNDTILTRDHEGRCHVCQSINVHEYCNLIDPFEIAYRWPCAMFLDPHPRKPHCISWFVVSPADDLIQVAEMEIDKEPKLVWEAIQRLERQYRLQVYRRYMDPNMALAPSTSAKLIQSTVRDEFDKVGLRMALADDTRDTARVKIRSWLHPDSKTNVPRLRFFRGCKRTDWQMQRYSWDEWTRYSRDSKDPKPKPREKNDDFPTLLGYAANANLTFHGLRQSSQVIRRQRPDNSRSSWRSPLRA